MWRRTTLPTLLMALAVVAGASGLTCFCNEPQHNLSGCNATRRSCHVPEGGCCYQHRNKIPVPHRDPSGDLRSDYYGCLTDPLQCMLSMESDMFRDSLYAACNQGDFCNRKSREALMEGVLEGTHVDKHDDIKPPPVPSFRSALVLAATIGGLLITLTVVAVAYMCLKHGVRPIPVSTARRQGLSYHRPSSVSSTDSQYPLELSVTKSDASSLEWTPKLAGEARPVSVEGTEITYIDMEGSVHLQNCEEKWRP